MRSQRLQRAGRTAAIRHAGAGVGPWWGDSSGITQLVDGAEVDPWQSVASGHPTRRRRRSQFLVEWFQWNHPTRRRRRSQFLVEYVADGPVGVVGEGVDGLDRHHRAFEGGHAVERQGPLATLCQGSTSAPSTSWVLPLATLRQDQASAPSTIVDGAEVDPWQSVASGNTQLAAGAEVSSWWSGSSGVHTPQHGASDVRGEQDVDAHVNLQKPQDLKPLRRQAMAYIPNE